MSIAGRPSAHPKQPSEPKRARNGWLLWLEVFGHGLVLIIVVALLSNRIIGLGVIIAYLTLQVIVMVADGFKTWQAWPFIVRDWRQKGRNR